MVQTLRAACARMCMQVLTGRTFDEWVDISFRGGSRRGAK